MCNVQGSEGQWLLASHEGSPQAASSPRATAAAPGLGPGEGVSVPCPPLFPTRTRERVLTPASLPVLASVSDLRSPMSKTRLP